MYIKIIVFWVWRRVVGYIPTFRRNLLFEISGCYTVEYYDCVESDAAWSGSHFGGICCFHLQCRRNRKVGTYLHFYSEEGRIRFLRNVDTYLSHFHFPRWRHQVAPKHRYQLTKLLTWKWRQPVDSKGFWRWCVTLRVTGFSDFVHRSVF
jgi:hypothetical protein